MKVIINPDTLKQDYIKLNKILYELRLRTKFWKEYYGSDNRLKKDEAEAVADEWLKNNVIEN